MVSKWRTAYQWLTRIASSMAKGNIVECRYNLYHLYHTAKAVSWSWDEKKKTSIRCYAATRPLPQYQKNPAFQHVLIERGAMLVSFFFFAARNRVRTRNCLIAFRSTLTQPDRRFPLRLHLTVRPGARVGIVALVAHESRAPFIAQASWWYSTIVVTVVKLRLYILVCSRYVHTGRSKRGVLIPRSPDRKYIDPSAQTAE